MSNCVVVVRHKVIENQFDYACQRIHSNGARMAQAVGFVSRVLARPPGGQNELITVTVWASKADYENWTEVNRKANVHRDSPSPYIGSPETHVYEEVSLQGSK